MTKSTFRAAILIALCTMGAAVAAPWGWTAGAADNNWTTNGNWNRTNYPGGSATTDIVFIDTRFTSDFPVVLDSTLPNSITDLTMEDGTSGSPVGLDVYDGDGTPDEVLLTITGSFIVQERSGQSGAYIQINPSSGNDKIEVSGDVQVIGGASTSVTLEVKGGTLQSI